MFVTLQFMVFLLYLLDFSKAFAIGWKKELNRAFKSDFYSESFYSTHSHFTVKC